MNSHGTKKNYMELELNASFIFEYQFKIPGKKNGPKQLFKFNSILKFW